ncbi:hypothetical protein ACI6QG_03580 [Roseococcus sp. DSY-14]|uniref:hypothetical protein n=1 Tax=Roseococcus sp. DSY-14 TaxID=3369650 RepID=UPI00387AFDEF
MTRMLAVLAWGWCAAFPLAGLGAGLLLFGDGALFSYAVAAADSWDFHFRQIPARAAAWALTAGLGEAVTRLAGAPEAGVLAFHAAFLALPALGLAATLAADRTGRILPWACASAALLLPLVFGFPTELWVAHAAFWPALALGWHAAPLPWLALALGITALSHEAGLLWAVGLVGLLALAPGWRPLRRGALALLPALAGFALLKLAVRPDPYVAEVMGRVGAGFFQWRPALAPLLLTIAAVLSGWLLLAPLTRWAPVLVAAALVAWWASGLAPLHAEGRYFARTLLFLGAALLAFGAALHARGWLPRPRRDWRPALLLVTLVHAGEAARFTAGWLGHAAAVRALAATPGAGPIAGTVLPAASAPFAWHSTLPFLSVMLAPGLAPARLVVDPASDYFWFGCAQARRNAASGRALPGATRAAVARHACAGRP